MKHRIVSSRITTFQEHIIAFVIACFVIAWIWWVVFYRDSLFADITNAQWQPWQKYSSPLVYTVHDGKLSISSTKQFTDITSVTFFVVFDPSKILLQLEKAQSSYQYTYAPGMETMVQVTIFPKWTVWANTVLYTVPVNGSAENITIANAWVLWKNNVFETLAIQKDEK